MIYRYCPFKIFPYDAVVNIESTSSSLTSISTGYNYYVASSIEPTITTFRYQGKNGTPVELGTNLKVISGASSINGSNIYSLNNSGYFTLSNEDIFTTDTQPYIWIGCNGVKVECFFTTGNRENGFDSLKISSGKFNVSTSITGTDGHTSKANVSFAQYITVNWNSETSNTVFFGEDNASSEIGHSYKIYSFANNTQTQIWNLIHHSESTQPRTVIVPALNTVSGYSYRIGYTVWFDGEETYTCSSIPKIRGSCKLYTGRTIATTTIETPQTLANSEGKILTYSLNGWGSGSFKDGFYKLSSSDLYISPADNVEISYTHSKTQ